jgi:hypothetical protein
MKTKDIIKVIKDTLKNDHLFSDEEVRYLKNQLREVEFLDKEERSKNKKGFGNNTQE